MALFGVKGLIFNNIFVQISYVNLTNTALYCHVSVMFSGKQTTARKMADQLRTVLIKEHMGFTVTAYILRAQYELLTL